MHFLYSIVHMFCPSLIMVISFLIIVRLLTLISLNVQTAAAKIILGCLKTTSHEIILKDLGLTPLFIRRQFHILKPSVPSFLDHVHRSYLRLLQNFLKIFPTTPHASIQTFNYLPVKHIPCIIFFFIKAQNSGILYPLIFII